MLRNRAMRAPRQFPPLAPRIPFGPQFLLLPSVEDLDIELLRQVPRILRAPDRDEPRIHPLPHHLHCFAIDERLHERWESLEEVGERMRLRGHRRYFTGRRTPPSVRASS